MPSLSEWRLNEARWRPVWFHSSITPDEKLQFVLVWNARDKFSFIHAVSMWFQLGEVHTHWTPMPEGPEVEHE